MATTTSVQGSVTLRKLRSGSTVGVSIWTSQQLFQTYVAGDYDTIAPDWSKEPYLTCKVIVNGAPYEGTVEWQINGTPVTSMEKINVVVDNGTLTIKSNLARALDYKNGTLKAVFKLDQTSMTKTTDITIMQVTDSQFNVLLSADNGGVVDKTKDCLITARVLKGAKEITEANAELKPSQLYYKWWSADNDKAVSDQSGKGKTTCKVTSGMVDGMELYFCSISQTDGGEVLDTSAIAITDNSDPYRLSASVSESTEKKVDNQTLYDVPESASSVKVEFKLINSDGTDVSATEKGKYTIEWESVKYHSDTMNYIEGSSATQTLPASNPKTTGGSTTKVEGSYSNLENGVIYVHDCDYVSTEKPEGVNASPHNTNVIVQADCKLTLKA